MITKFSKKIIKKLTLISKKASKILENYKFKNYEKLANLIPKNFKIFIKIGILLIEKSFLYFFNLNNFFKKIENFVFYKIKMTKKYFFFNWAQLKF